MVHVDSCPLPPAWLPSVSSTYFPLTVIPEAAHPRVKSLAPQPLGGDAVSNELSLCCGATISLTFNVNSQED